MPVLRINLSRIYKCLDALSARMLLFYEWQMLLSKSPITIFTIKRKLQFIFSHLYFSNSDIVVGWSEPQDLNNRAKAYHQLQRQIFGCILMEKVKQFIYTNNLKTAIDTRIISFKLWRKISTRKLSLLDDNRLSVRRPSRAATSYSWGPLGAQYSMYFRPVRTSQLSQANSQWCPRSLVD
jgi:hypothetical protein